MSQPTQGQRYRPDLRRFEDGADEVLQAEIAQLVSRRRTATQDSPQAEPPVAEAGAAGPTLAPTEQPQPGPRPSRAPSRSPSHGPSQGRANGSEPSPVSTQSAGTPPRPDTPRRTRSGASRKGRGGGASVSAANEPVSRILYLPVELVEAIRVYRATHPGVTNTQIALRALNAHHDDLADLLTAEQATQLSPGPLFDVETTTTALPKRQVEITPTLAQLQVIDRLQQDSGTRDRSHMCALVIKRWLDGSPNLS
ncbi:MAG: hypothetical protein WCG47_24165 [Dermatophilaceae bacterium]